MNLLDAPVVLRDRRARRSRTALLTTAVSLVCERGTTVISLSELAEAAGLSRQAVYQQFPDRDAILIEAALDLTRRGLAPLLFDGLKPPPGETGPEAGTGARTDHPDDARSEPGPPGPGRSDREGVHATAAFFAGHRDFFRPMLTGQCAYPMRLALTELFIPFNRLLVADRFGDALPPTQAADLAAFLTGGAAALIDGWLIDGPDPLDPYEFTDRMLQVMPLIIPTEPEGG